MRLIDADKFKEDLLKLWDYNSVDGITATTVLKQVISDLDNVPTVCGNNPKWCESCISKGKCASTRPQGEWIFHKDYNESCRYGCNQCGNLNNIPHNYCPNCGSKMSKEGIKKGGAE